MPKYIDDLIEIAKKELREARAIIQAERIIFDLEIKFEELQDDK